jgi:hypothetical protein
MWRSYERKTILELEGASLRPETDVSRRRKESAAKAGYSLDWLPLDWLPHKKRQRLQEAEEADIQRSGRKKQPGGTAHTMEAT